TPAASVAREKRLHRPGGRSRACARGSSRRQRPRLGAAGAAARGLRSPHKRWRVGIVSLGNLLARVQDAEGTLSRILARFGPQMGNVLRGSCTRRYELSLSRLNHRLPGCETHPEVMQGTAEFHHEITDTRLPQADPVFDDTAPLDTAIHMLDPQPTVVQRLI